jgi:hypothetical protein
MGTEIVIKDGLLYPDSTCTLQSFKDICANGFHMETKKELDVEYLVMTKFDGYQITVVETLP